MNRATLVSIRDTLRQAVGQSVHPTTLALVIDAILGPERGSWTYHCLACKEDTVSSERIYRCRACGRAVDADRA